MTIRTPQLQVQQRGIGSLHAWAGNPRSHTDKQVKQLARSIRTFGFNCPILIDAHDCVIAGHGRLMAAQALGWSEVPTIALEHLSPHQVQAYRIADNRLTDLSEWDERLLALELKALHDADLDFEIEAIGFEMPEIDLRIQSLAMDEFEEDEPQLLSSPVVSQLGDLWQLGDHRILCGDALQSESYARLLQGEHADMVITDLPFNRSVTRDLSHNGQVQHPEFPMASGEMTTAEFTAFLTTVFERITGAGEPGALIYAFMDWRGISEITNAGQAAGLDLKNLVVWNKGTGGMGSFYRSQHELIFVYKHGKAQHTNNIQLGRFGRNRTNVWDYPGINSFARQSEEGDLLSLHPTVKPLALIADGILDASERGSCVLDPFLGSGTAILACERTGRHGRGIELEARYVDTSLRRWERATGQRARHVDTGLSFEDMSAQRIGSARATEAGHDQSQTL